MGGCLWQQRLWLRQLPLFLRATLHEVWAPLYVRLSSPHNPGMVIVRGAMWIVWDLRSIPNYCDRWVSLRQFVCPSLSMAVMFHGKCRDDEHTTSPKQRVRNTRYIFCILELLVRSCTQYSTVRTQPVCPYHDLILVMHNTAVHCTGLGSQLGAWGRVIFSSHRASST